MAYPSRLRPRNGGSSPGRPHAGHSGAGHHTGSHTSGGILEVARERVHRLDESREVKARTNPLDIERLKQEELTARLAYGRARRAGTPTPKLLGKLLVWALARAARTRLLRAVNLFFFHYGTVMAAGAAYMMFFSVAALIWAGFSVAGIVIGGNPDYQEFILEAVQSALPGLIGSGGLITEQEALGLFDVGGLNLSLAIAVLVALVTSLSWMHGLRSGIRSLWERPLMAENVIFVKIKDFGVLILLGVVALTSAVLGVLSYGFIHEVFDVLGWEAGGLTALLTQLATFVISFGLDMVIAVLLMRVASRLVIPVGALWQSALIAGIGAFLLRLASTQLLQNFADSPNPVLTSFGTVLGAFFYFYLFGLVYLIASAWGAVVAADQAERRR